MSDTRVMHGPIKRDQARKLGPLTDSIGATAAGLLGAKDYVLEEVKEFCNSGPVSLDDVVSYLSESVCEWWEENQKKLEEGEEVPFL